MPAAANTYSIGTEFSFGADSDFSPLDNDWSVHYMQEVNCGFFPFRMLRVELRYEIIMDLQVEGYAV